MNRSEMVRFLIIKSIGNFLLLFSIYGVIATFGPALSYELAFHITQAQGIHYSVAEATSSSTNTVSSQPSPSFASLLSGQKDQVIIAKDTDFSIVIPRIGASAKIYPNVDTANQDEFLNILQKGVAHAKGSVFPGFAGTVYLFAHSTDNWWNVGRYNAVFYLLKDLVPSDQIVIFFEGRRYNYIVEKTIITDPTDTSLLQNSHSSVQQVVLQTCWPPGTTWKRLFVIAKPKVN